MAVYSFAAEVAGGFVRLRNADSAKPCIERSADFAIRCMLMLGAVFG
jgi:hypothetical protein